MKKVLKHKKILIITVFVIFVVGGFFIYKKITDDKAKGAQETQVIAKAEKGNLKSTVSVSGQVETANYLTVTTSVNGIVKEVFVKEGDTVVKGQKLMEITLNAAGEESLAQAWSSYLSAKNSLESAKNGLYAKESAVIEAENSFDTEKEDNSYQSEDERESYKIAENSYLSTKNEYELQKASISQTQVNLNKAWLSYQAQSPSIVAPGSGVIANIVVVEGMDITNSLSERTSATVASIKQDGTPIASLNVSEVDINKISVGQKVEITLNSIEEKVFIGSVAGIDKIGSISSGVTNYPVIVKFEEKSDLVLPNMGVDAEIILEEKNDVTYVPTSAISGGKSGKLSVDTPDGKKEVNTGIKTADYIEIVSGISEGQEVYVKSLPTSGFSSGQGSSFRPSGSFIMGPGR